MENNSSNHNFTTGLQSKSDGLPDIRKIFQIAINNWYLFVISFPLFFGGLFLYHRYTLDIYKGTVTVMLKSDEPKSISRTELIEGFGLSPEMKSLENQTIILRSTKVVKRAIDRLEFGIDLYSNGIFKDSDMYGKSPFKIVMDSSHVQLVNTPIYIKPLGQNKVSVSIETDNALLHTYSNEEYSGGSGPIAFNKTVNWGDEIQTPFCKFRLLSNNGDHNPEIKYYFYFRSQSWLAETYRRKINVNPYKEGSSIIYISTNGSNTTKIIRFLNALSQVYLEQSLERKNDIATRTINFIETQLQQVADSLNNAQEKLMNFKRSNILSAPSEMSVRMADQYFEYEKNINLLSIKESYFKNLENHLLNDSISEDYLLPAFSQDANSFISTIVTEMLSLINERSILLTQTSKDNPYLQELYNRIEVSKNNLLLAIDKLIKNIDIEKGKMITQKNQLAGKMNQLPDVERKYLDIEREYKLNDAIYTFLLQKYSETQITKASNAPDNEIIDEATITCIVSPNRQKNTKQALLFALAFPIAIIVLKEYLNNKIRDKDEITSLAQGVPVFGYISQYKGEHNNVIHEEPLSNISESFRALRTKLKFMCPPDQKHVITITSTNTGEGKTFCALNLSAAFAISGKKTVLVGFDLRKPRLTEIFKHQNHNGLSNYLIGHATIDDIVYTGKMENLHIIPSGAIPPNPSELIANERAQELFKELTVHFDVIVVDTPPIGVVADSSILMDYSNCHLFVVRSGKTNKEHFKHTIQNLMSEKVDNLGFIFNDIPSSMGGYNYYTDRYYSET